VIKGETSHDVYISQAVTSAIMQLGVIRSKPFIYGLLTTNNIDQAKDRAGGAHGNKGVEAAVTAIKMILLKKQLKSPSKTIGF
jgi:6,7-dimethyl-8-ribityllumazine synthase